MKAKVDPKSHIGEQYGIYEIKELMPEKNKHRSYIYKGICTECGFEKYATLNDFKRKNVQKCTHINSLTEEQINIWYEQNKKKCLFCGEFIPLGSNGFNEYKNRKFCDNSCAASYNNQFTKLKIIEKICLNCGKKIKRKNKYCSTECQKEFQYKEYITRWKNGDENGMCGQYGISKYIRRYLYEKYNNKCSSCGWHEKNLFTGNIPLEVHHIDGDYTNNDENNLQLLCPNCHSLTETYKAANKHGRKERKKYNSS